MGVQGEVELCAGTLRAWDQHVASVETKLGIARDPDDKLEVYIVEDAAPWCKDVMACYIGGWVDATFVPAYASRAVWHELVHHVVSGSDLGMTDRFFSEGLAGALGDSWCPPPGASWPAPPLRSLVAQPDVAYEHYARAAQFVDYVQQEHGTAALVRLVDCVERGAPTARVEACVEQIFGRSLDGLGRRFDADTPELHGNPALCEGEPLPWHGQEWSYEAALSCGDPEVINTFTSKHGRETSALVELPRAGRYAVVLTTDGEAALEIEPCFCPGSDGGLLYDPETSTVWVGEPGRYRMVFRTADPRASRLRVDLWPLEDPTPPPGLASRSR